MPKKLIQVQRFSGNYTVRNSVFDCGDFDVSSEKGWTAG
jgi:hypothetical protein